MRSAGRALPLFVALACALAIAVPALAADFKIPPTPDHYVTDTANALSSDARSSLENELQAYERATGHQVIVYIGDTTGDVPLETWTADSAHQWRIGRRGKDDGAILFLFMKDHKIRIEVGYGLESSLTDADASRIINDIIRPKMRANDTDGAVSGGVAAMLKTITPAYAAVTAPPVEEEPTTPRWMGLIYGFASLFGVVILGVLYIIVMQIVGSVRYGYLVLREGAPAAKKQMKSWPTWSSSGGGSASSSGGGGDDFGGGDFDAGGGDFGGGGASGGW
jgi:uncharacterized protein